MNLINALEYHKTTVLLREFFIKKGYIEVPTQSRLSILAACEDPTTIGSFDYNGQVWPLPQTGQMWLEYELLKNPKYPGVFCQSTSYRQEANPEPGRHDFIFPMFEFESRGTMEDLIKLEEELLLYLGFPRYTYPVTGEEAPWLFPKDNYEAMTTETGSMILTSKDEEYIGKKYGPVFFLKNFPESTSPFWNMKRNEYGANKVDVIIHGMETIGSAERETNPDVMFRRFHTISNGMYAELLFAHFGRERVLNELEEFLALPMVSRFGGGMGITRLIRALKLENLI